ncbi:TBC1 domain family member 23 [Aphelenchoides fujianensis]|nr:TBC1 domain family member 23 [Aphelenchoides fujianensis]
MTTVDDELEFVNEGATSDEWVKDLSESSDTTSPNNNEEPKATAFEALHLRWDGLLGVRNRPDPLLDWDQLYNLKNQATLRKDCIALCEKTKTKLPAHELESLITLYCKRRELEYESGNGWMAIMEVLLSLPFDLPTLFNVFYSITTKYIPRDTSVSAKVFDLFRLILQYHEPQLCVYLDSMKIQPQVYATEWFTSLLSSSLDANICRVLWDFYFQRGDPFIVFFIALSFLQCTREQILKSKDKAEVVELIRAAPTNMSEEDIGDLFEVCVVTLNCTPDSLRQDFHGSLFGSNFLDEFTDFPLNRIICLPVSVKEVFKRVIDLNAPRQVFNYFVIDARPHSQFTCGSLLGAYNLNARLIVDEPENFRIAMQSLLQFKTTNHPKDHVCFVGSGVEAEDASMLMVISRFLQQNIPHVSYVDGGYKAIHSMLKETNNLHKLNNHLTPENCSECAEQRAEPSGWGLMERMRKSITEKKDAVKSRVQNMVDYSTPAAKGAPIRHVRSSERNGKRYKNTQQSVFSINDDSDLSDDEHAGNLVASSSTAAEKLKWADVIRRPDAFKHFEGHEIFQDRSYLKCSILITYNHLVIYHNVEKEPDLVVLHAQHPLPSIIRVTSKRRVPEFLTFSFGKELPNGETNITRRHCFLLNKSGDCAQAIKQAMHRLGALSTPDIPLESPTTPSVLSIPPAF